MSLLQSHPSLRSSNSVAPPPGYPTSKLAGKVAIITGGAKGIGLACAKVFVRHGAKVVLGDIDTSAAIAAVSRIVADGGDAIAVKVDVSIKEEVDAMIEKAVDHFGTVDIMVANAGIVRAAPFLEMTEEDFDHVIAVNLKGVFLCCQSAARQMVRQLTSHPGLGPGTIVTMSSVNSVLAIPTISGYNASKGGVNGLTKSMALALAPLGIRVNGVGPGSIRTDVLASVVNDPSAMDRVMSRTPLGRVGEPEEIGELVAFLASSESSYMTGQIVFADGGRLALNYTV